MSIKVLSNAQDYITLGEAFLIIKPKVKPVKGIDYITSDNPDEKESNPMDKPPYRKGDTILVNETKYIVNEMLSYELKDSTFQVLRLLDITDDPTKEPKKKFNPEDIK